MVVAAAVVAAASVAARSARGPSVPLEGRGRWVARRWAARKLVRELSGLSWTTSRPSAREKADRRVGLKVN